MFIKNGHSLLIGILFFLLVHPKIHAQSSSPDYACLYGTLKVTPPDENLALYFIYDTHPVTLQPKRIAISVVDGAFKVELPVKERFLTGKITWGEGQLPVFLEKGDSLQIHFGEVHQFPENVHYAGNAAANNHFLLEYQQQFGQVESRQVREGQRLNTLFGFKILMDTYLEARLAFLAKAGQDQRLSDDFLCFFENHIAYWHAAHLLDAAQNDPQQAEKEKGYFDFLDSLALDVPEVLSSVYYREFLQAYTHLEEYYLAQKQDVNPVLVADDGQELIEVKTIETFAEVVMDHLEVRQKAHDAASTFARLQAGTEVLYLQDITTDRFKYAWKGSNYLDFFLKIQLEDGRTGWVFQGGVQLEEKIVYKTKWVTGKSQHQLQHKRTAFRHFSGKVLDYLIAHEIFKIIQRDLDKGEVAWQHLEEYFPENIYVEDLENFIREQKQIIADEKATFTQVLVPPGSLFEKEPPLPGTTPSVGMPFWGDDSNLKIEQPDFSPYSRLTKISGHLESLPKTELLVNTQPVVREGTVVELSKRGEHFDFDFSLCSPTSAELKSGDYTLQLYIQPGDSLAINATGLDWTTLQFSGKGAGINNYLLAKAIHFKDEIQQINHSIASLQPDDFKKLLREMRTAQSRFLEEYSKKNTFTETELAYARGAIDYWFAFNLMNYPYEHPIYHDQPVPMPLPDDYYDFLEEFPVNNAAALPDKYYLFFLQDFISYQSSQPQWKNTKREQIAKQYLKGEPLHYYLALQLSLASRQKKGKVSKRKIQQFLEECPDALYRNYVRAAYHQHRELQVGMQAPSFELQDIEGKKVSLDDLRGKIVFLDFWATWCTPCLRQIPDQRNLQQLFSDKEVVFVYVSMDKDTEHWKNFVRQRQLPGVHLLAGASKEGSSITKKYKVQSLPSNVLINSEGEIVWHNTGGYSISSLQKKIQQLLQ